MRHPVEQWTVIHRQSSLEDPQSALEQTGRIERKRLQRSAGFLTAAVRTRIDGGLRFFPSSWTIWKDRTFAVALEQDVTNDMQVTDVREERSMWSPKCRKECWGLCQEL
jgi:hypothetical protein